jgi:hypothetical protein
MPLFHSVKSCVIKTSLFAAAVLVLMTPAALHATSMDYNFTLPLTDSSNSNFNGTATFTLDLPSAPVAFTDYSFSALTIVINDGGSPVTFNLTDAGVGANPFVQFSAVGNGTAGSTYTVNDINFTDQLGNLLFDVQTSDRYTFNHRSSASGQYSQEFGDEFSTNLATLGSVSPVTNGNPPSPTPEPSSIFLLGTGLLGGAGSLYRRYRQQKS